MGTADKPSSRAKASSAAGAPAMSHRGEHQQSSNVGKSGSRGRSKWDTDAASAAPTHPAEEDGRVDGENRGWCSKEGQSLQAKNVEVQQLADAQGNGGEEVEGSDVGGQESEPSCSEDVLLRAEQGEGGSDGSDEVEGAGLAPRCAPPRKRARAVARWAAPSAVV